MTLSCLWPYWVIALWNRNPSPPLPISSNFSLSLDLSIYLTPNPIDWDRTGGDRIWPWFLANMYGFEALNFNINDGYLEAIVRGYRSGLLTAADYNNLCQCESLDDIKMHLSATDYGRYLQNGIIIYSSAISQFSP